MKIVWRYFGVTDLSALVFVNRRVAFHRKASVESLPNIRIGVGQRRGFNAGYGGRAVENPLRKRRPGIPGVFCIWNIEAQREQMIRAEAGIDVQQDFETT